MDGVIVVDKPEAWTSHDVVNKVRRIANTKKVGHLGTLDQAGLVERAPVGGREVAYRLRPGALAPASAWMRATEAAWDQRLARLKGAVEGRG